MLQKPYYDLSNSGAYLGPATLDGVLKSNGITRIGKNKVRKWLHNQDDYSLRRELRYSVRKARVVVAGIDDQFDMDLTNVSNISNENDSIGYLLFVIDIFSKYLWIKPLKNKTAKGVVKALQNLLTKDRKCKKLRSDRGKEFNNNTMKPFLKQENIYYFTTLNSDTTANVAERGIKTYKYDLFIFHHAETSQIFRSFARNGHELQCNTS